MLPAGSLSPLCEVSIVCVPSLADSKSFIFRITYLPKSDAKNVNGNLSWLVMAMELFETNFVFSRVKMTYNELRFDNTVSQ